MTGSAPQHPGPTGSLASAGWPPSKATLRKQVGHAITSAADPGRAHTVPAFFSRLSYVEA